MLPARLVRAIDQVGVLPMVWAAGNDYEDCGRETSITCIESNQGSISVAALDRNLMPHTYSGRGPGYCSPLQPFIGAPTFGVIPWGGGWIDTKTQGAGTSSTAPLVSAALAILKSIYPKATNLELRTALAISADPLGRPQSWYKDIGFGLLQVDRAIAMMPEVTKHPFYNRIREAMFAPLPPITLSDAVRDF